MEYRRMGKTGLQLSILSYGSWVTFHKQIDESIADELMGMAYDAFLGAFPARAFCKSRSSSAAKNSLAWRLS